MKITAKHFAKLRQSGDEDFIKIEMEPGSTVNDLLSKLGIEQNEFGTLIVNGKAATFAQELEDGSSVTLIPYIGGD